MKCLHDSDLRRELTADIAITIPLAVAGSYISTAAGVLALLLALALALAHVLSMRRRLRRMSELADELNSILHGSENYDLDKFSEGELSILESELSKLIVTLRQQSENLKNDKVFLAESLADISHQLKTPLTSINLSVAMLSAPDITEERRLELTRDADRSLTRIEWLVSALLKMSRLDAGMAELARERVTLREVLDLAAAPLAIPLELREVELADEVGSEAFIGDATWTSEALGNLLKNSMEHTQPGGVIRLQSRENALFCELTIHDSGPGFDIADLPHLFERFYRGKNATPQSVGIGLALSRAIIAAEGGSLTAENARDGGALFTVRFYKGAV